MLQRSQDFHWVLKWEDADLLLFSILLHVVPGSACHYDPSLAGFLCRVQRNQTSDLNVPDSQDLWQSLNSIRSTGCV